MKKVSSIALALLFAASAFAHEQIGQLNPYAYGVQGQAKNGKIAVQYSLNAPADSTVIAIYCDEVEVGTQVVADNAPGLHSAVVDFSAFTTPGTYTVGIRVYATPYDKPFQLKEILDGSTDTTALNYGFDHPKGVDIDVDPFSENFGRLLTVECLYDLNEKWWSQGKPGIYAFDAAFKPIPNGNDRGFYGNYPYAYEMNEKVYNSNNKLQNIAYAPYRVRISKDGRIFVSTQDDKGSALYEISADLQTWTPIFNGAFNSDCVVLDADGKYITGLNCGLDVIGEGEDLEIIMLNGSKASYTSFSGNDYMVAHYKIGANTVWNSAATQADTLSKFVGAAAVPVMGSAGIAWDDKGGFWFHSARSNMIDQRGLCHVSPAGAVDFEFHATAADSTKYHILPNGSNGGAGVRVIKLDGEDVLFVGQGRRAADGTGHMMAYKVIYANDGSVSDIEVLYDEHFIGISTNLNDFAVDFGHNLYVVGNSNEKIIPVALPYSGMTETPVDAEVIRTSLDNVNGEMKATKMIENGKVIIIKNGVKYDMLGTVIE